MLHVRGRGLGRSCCSRPTRCATACCSAWGSSSSRRSQASTPSCSSRRRSSRASTARTRRTQCCRSAGPHTKLWQRHPSRDRCGATVAVSRRRSRCTARLASTASTSSRRSLPFSESTRWVSVPRARSPPATRPWSARCASVVSLELAWNATPVTNPATNPVTNPLTTGLPLEPDHQPLSRSPAS